MQECVYSNGAESRSCSKECRVHALQQKSAGRKPSSLLMACFKAQLCLNKQQGHLASMELRYRLLGHTHASQKRADTIQGKVLSFKGHFNTKKTRTSMRQKTVGRRENGSRGLHKYSF
eukprot:scaffold219872_cov14-Tisochrysis_lutea.AAC.2